MKNSKQIPTSVLLTAGYMIKTFQFNYIDAEKDKSYTVTTLEDGKYQVEVIHNYSRGSNASETNQFIERKVINLKNTIGDIKRELAGNYKHLSILKQDAQSETNKNLVGDALRTIPDIETNIRNNEAAIKMYEGMIAKEESQKSTAFCTTDVYIFSADE